SFFFTMIPHPPTSTLFPYTTLFRSQTSVASNLPAVWCNRHRTKQVFTNLIRNAAKHGCNPSGPHIAISSRLVEIDAASEAEITIDRKSTRLNSSHVAISYAVFCLKK